MAAVELAFLDRDVFGSLNRKNGLEPWQKTKVDRQIIAVAKVANCGQILSEDDGLCNIEPLKVFDLPIPDAAKQHPLPLEEHDDLPETDVVPNEDVHDGLTSPNSTSSRNPLAS